MMKARAKTGVNISGQVSLSANLGVSDRTAVIMMTIMLSCLSFPLLSSSPALSSCVALIPPHTL